jgi:hypothetical protein
LPAIALAVALGWEEVATRPRAARWASLAVLASAGLAALLGLLREDLSKWSVALLGAVGLGLAGWSLALPQLARAWRTHLEATAFFIPFIALPLLDVFALYAYILPQLA